MKETKFGHLLFMTLSNIAFIYNKINYHFCLMAYIHVLKIPRTKVIQEALECARRHYELDTIQPDTSSDLKSHFHSTDKITNFYQHTRDLVDSLLTDLCMHKLTVQYQANHKYMSPGFVDQMRQWEQQQVKVNIS